MTQPSLSTCPTCGWQGTASSPFCENCGYYFNYNDQEAYLKRAIDSLRALCQGGGERLSIERLCTFSRDTLPDLRLSLQQLNSRPDTIKDLLTIYTSRLQASDPYTHQQEEWLRSMCDDLKRLCASGGAELQVDSLLALPLTFVNDLRLICNHNKTDRPLIEHLQEYENLLACLISSHMPASSAPAVPLPPLVPDSVAPESIAPGITKPWGTFFHDSFVMTATIAAFLILAATLLLTLFPTSLFPIPTNTNPGAFITIILISLALLLLAFRFKRLSSDPAHDYRLLSLFYILASLSLAPELVIKVVSSQASSADWVVPLTALYVSLTCAVCSISQQFKLLGYMSMISLAIASVATATSFYPSDPFGAALVLLMLLALPMLCSLGPKGDPQAEKGPRIPSLKRFWPGVERRWQGATILRDPMRRVMFVVVCGVAVSALLLTPVGVGFTLQGNPIGEDGSLFLTLCLGWLWGYLFLRGTGSRKKGAWFGLALLSLGCIFTFVHLVRSPYEGYLLALLAAAFLYSTMSHSRYRWLQPFSPLHLPLDMLALSFVGVIPFISLSYEPLPEALLGISSQSFFPFSLIPSTLGAALALYLTLWRVRSASSPSAASSWSWLLLIPGSLASWSYSALLLVLHLPPLAGILAFTIFVASLTLFWPYFAKTDWSGPLDVLALALALLTLFLSSFGSFGSFFTLHNSLITGVLSFFFAVLSYCIVRRQDRFFLLFLPACLGLLTFSVLSSFPVLVFVLSLSFPFLALLLYQRRASSTALLRWEWPLLALGGYGGLALTSTYAFSPGFFASAPLALYLALLAIAWYSAAILVNKPGWLLFSITFLLLIWAVSVFSLTCAGQCLHGDRSTFILTTIGIAVGSALGGILLHWLTLTRKSASRSRHTSESPYPPGRGASQEAASRQDHSLEDKVRETKQVQQSDPSTKVEAYTPHRAAYCWTAFVDSLCVSIALSLLFHSWWVLGGGIFESFIFACITAISVQKNRKYGDQAIVLLSALLIFPVAWGYVGWQCGSLLSHTIPFMFFPHILALLGGVAGFIGYLFTCVCTGVQ